MQKPRTVTRCGGRARLRAGRFESEPIVNEPPSIHSIDAGQRGASSGATAATEADGEALAGTGGAGGAGARPVAPSLGGAAIAGAPGPALGANAEVFA